MAHWTDWNARHDEDERKARHWYFLRIYLTILATAFMFVCYTRLTSPIMTVRAARNIFLHAGVSVRAPTHWYDTTPMGRVLNRFSFDAENLDVVLLTVFPAIVSISWTSGSFMVLSILIFPWFILMMPFILYAYVHLLQVSENRSGASNSSTIFQEPDRIAGVSCAGAADYPVLPELRYMRDRWKRNWTTTRAPSTASTQRQVAGRAPRVFIIGQHDADLLLHRFLNLSPGAASFCLLWCITLTVT